jgi:hypothetical protein
MRGGLLWRQGAESECGNLARERSRRIVTNSRSTIPSGVAQWCFRAAWAGPAGRVTPEMPHDRYLGHPTAWEIAEAALSGDLDHHKWRQCHGSSGQEAVTARSRRTA